MSDKKSITPPAWLGKPIVDDSHAQDLETKAALNEFHHKMPREEAESKAHAEYVQEQRERAAAHHLKGMKAAMSSGNHEDAKKHWAMYDLHLKGLGKESIGAVPDEVEKRMTEDSKNHLYKFKAHKGDLYALSDAEKAPVKEGEPAEMAKAEHTCQWKLGERRCKNSGTRVVGGKHFCHHHENHWANKIFSKSEDEVKAFEVLFSVYRLLHPKE